MEFRILGSVEVFHEGRSVSLGGSRERAVLALLLTSPNRVVSAERLAEDLWAGEPPDRAIHTLQVFVSRLRKALREAGVDGIIVTRPPGYVAEVPPESLDATRFEALVGESRRQAAEGAPERAAATLRTALALWRGAALADVADGPIARAEAARLEEGRLAALEERVDAELACGRHAELTAELDSLTRAYPLRERLWGQRMLALYRCGRQVEALRVYQELRRLLAEEVGLEPGPALATLETAILQQSPQLDWRPAAAPEPPVRSGPAPVAVPAPLHPAGPPLESLAGGPVTLLFTDVEASTDLRTRHGDEAAQDLLRRHEELVRDQVKAHGGVEVKALGDGFMMAFGSARRALACAVAIQRTLADRRLELSGIKVRIGVNTGEVVLQGDDLYGQAVHAAARIAAQAEGGEIFVSEIVKQLVGSTPEVPFVDRGWYELKGFPERFHLFEVVWDQAEPVPAAAFAARTPYVGREAERSELARLVDGAGRGQGSLVLIGGEPGVGKTRLTEELGSEAAAKGFRVLIGRCYESDGAPPYVPFVEIFEQALAATPSPEAIRAILGDEAPEVAKLVPGLRRRFPDIPAPLELPPEQERYYLFNSLRDYLARAAAGRPLFLVLDDLHWADEGTLLLLEHLSERIPRLAVLAIGTYRDTEVTPEHRLARPLEGLLRRRLAHQLSLKRLPEEGVTALLRVLSGQEPPPLLVTAVHAETQGNPFFTEEVFKHLAEEGRLYDEDGRFRSEVTIGELEVPESLRLVLGRRLERLGDNGRRALAAAAVVGRAFTYELLEALGELAPEPLLDALEEAQRARLIAPLSDSPDEDRLLFSHELIRQTLLAELSPPRRRRLHLLVADTLERLCATTLDEQASEIAHHLTQAGPAADRRRLLGFLALAGRQAMRTADYEDALRHFEAAVAMAELAEPSERAELFTQRGFARRCVGRLEDALPDWQEALRLHDESGNVEDAAHMCHEASRDLFYLNRDREAMHLAERGLAVLGDRETPQRAEMLAWTGLSGAYVSPFEPGAALIDEALALAERLGDKRTVGYALVTRSLHRMAFSQYQEVLDAGLEGTRLLKAHGDLWEVCTALGLMEYAALELGRTQLAAELSAEVVTLASRLGHTFALEVMQPVYVWSTQLMTNSAFDVCEAEARRHLEVAGPLGFHHMSATMLAQVAFLRGNWDEALRWAEEAVSNSPEDHHTSGMDWACFLRMLAYSGRNAEVHAVLHERRSGLPRSGRLNGLGSWCIPDGAVEALWVIGDREGAAAFYPLVREFIETTGGMLHILGPHLVERMAGIGAAAGGQWALAEAHFQTALRQAEDLPYEIEGAETRRFYAEMLLDRNAPGDRDRARSLVEEALVLYRRVGMPRHEDLALRPLTT
ncbi:MAG TPA: BTAD domain-containing putative transcriptional regulator [Acidimicrobiia bacterium]|nr:BTAD domain-containing putative transcriptional regulator [Acidimicrobiia bacterium]